MSIFEFALRYCNGFWVAGLCSLFLAEAAVAEAAAPKLSVEQLRNEEIPKRLDAGFGWPTVLRLTQAGDGHSAHHPGAASSGGASAPEPNSPAAPMGGPPAASSSSSNPGMMGEKGMMGEMMGRPRKELYPSLMEMPALSAEQRRDLEAQARARIDSGIQSLSAAEADLRHALAGGDVAAADQASTRIRGYLDQVQSGVTVLRSLNEGKSPQQIAQAWFKAQMNLLPPPLTVTAEGVLGISWFHVTTMGLLVIFSSGMLTVYVARMRRANALVDRLTRAPAPAPAVPPSSPAVQGQSRTGDRIAVASTAADSASPSQERIATASATPAIGRLARAGEIWKGKLKVCAVFKETPSVKTFRLQDPQGGSVPFTFLPGQFLTYSAQIDGKTVRRSYTIASSAAQTAYVETTIKREDGGVFSDYLHDQIKEGDLLDVMAPSGAFTFTGKEADSVVLIGGGVGITPLMAAIRYLFDIAWPGQIHLVYSAQTTEQFIFRDELEYLQRRMNNLHVAATMARAAGTSWMGSEGQITAEFLTRAIPDLTKRRVHLCGPPGMMQAVKKTRPIHQEQIRPDFPQISDRSEAGMREPATIGRRGRCRRSAVPCLPSQASTTRFPIDFA